MIATLILHVSIALSSIVLASYAYMRPTKSKLRSSYALMALTLLSGFYLIWTTPEHMLQGCMTGIAYLSVVTAVTALARQKLGRQMAEVRESN